MPSLLSTRKRSAAKVVTAELNQQRIERPLVKSPDVVEQAATYVTPAMQHPRASQLDTFDLSASSGSTTVSRSQGLSKRPPSSPRKPKPPTKRRNVVDASDNDDDFFRDDDADEDVYMTILDVASKDTSENPLVTTEHHSPHDHELTVNADFSIIPDSPPMPDISPAALARNISADIPMVDQSPPKAVREDTPSVVSDLGYQSEQRMNGDFGRNQLCEVDSAPYIPTPTSLNRYQCFDNKKGQKPSKNKEELILALKAEQIHLKAEMTEIVEDESRGPYCSDAKANKRRRDEIQAQLASMVQDRASLQSKLESLQQKIVADAMNGLMPSDATKRDVQSITEQLKALDEARPTSRMSSDSAPPTIVKRLASPIRANRAPQTGRLNEHNQLAPIKYDSPRIQGQGKSVGRQLFQDRPINAMYSAVTHVSTPHKTSPSSPDMRHKSTELESEKVREVRTGTPTQLALATKAADVIELISDEDDVMMNMGHAVEFDEDDFSDGLDYAAEADIEAQKARYEELSTRSRLNGKGASRLPADERPSLSSQRSTAKGPLDNFMRPPKTQYTDPPSRVGNSDRGVEHSSQIAHVSASPTQHQAASRPAASQRVALTQGARVVRPTARPVDLMSLPGMNHAWSRDVVRAMNEVFKLRYFRSNQLEAINATLSGQDAFVLMPTGGGKSLCYQLPSIIQSGTTRGVTVVVSPLVSLMQDQVDHLEAVNIRAASFNSDRSQAERSEIMRQLSRNELDCIYVAPEMLAKSDAINRIFKQLWERESLARIVIDEAHCVSQWGHDFRPDYKKLGDFRREYDGVPVIALTATANDKVQVDVKNHLGLKNPACFKQSFNRPNLFYCVYPRTKGSNDKIKDLLDCTHKDQIGIIYCLSRAKCESMAAELGERAGFYHAGMKKDERADIQRLWQAGTIQVIVATIAFGMGIDKPDVRFVIHTSLPKSLEGYYQETGRAGRDGRKADCYLFWAFSDKVSLERMIDKGESDGQQISAAQKKVQKEGIQRVVDYADNKADCRRAQVLGFFNEPFDAKDCHETCDNCQSSEVYTDQDVTSAAKIAAQIARGVVACGSCEKDRRATINDLVSIARGSRAARITEKGWDRIDGFEGLKSDARWDIANTTKLFQHLISIDVLTDRHVPNAMGFTTTYCVPGSKSSSVLSNKINVTLKIQSPRAKKPAVARTNSRPERNTGMDDFIVDDDDDERENEPVRVSTIQSVRPPVWPKDLRQFRHDPDMHSNVTKVSKQTTPTTANRARRERDSESAMMEKMYAKTFSPVDLDRIARCSAELKQVRNAIQLKQGHRRTESTFSDQILQDIAVHLPITPGELLKIPDVKRENVDLHGFQILIVTNKYQEEIDALGVIDVDAQESPVARQEPSARSTKRSISRKPNYEEPYFQEPSDDEDDFILGDEEMVQESHHFQQAPIPRSTVQSALRPQDKSYTNQSATPTIKQTDKPSKTRSQPQSKMKASVGVRKTFGSSIGAAKPRSF